MPRGGARANSGRKPGALTKTCRDDAIAATRAVDLTPIQVMANNMRFWYDASMGLTDKITGLLEEVTPEMVQENPEILRELNTNLKNMLFARERAQECAVDMAPYRHPRLANIEVHSGFSNEDPNPEADKVPRITSRLTAKEAASAYEQSLKAQAERAGR